MELLLSALPFQRRKATSFLYSFHSLLPLSIPFPPLLLFKKEINIEKNSSFFSSLTKEKAFEKEKEISFFFSLEKKRKGERRRRKEKGEE